MVERIQRGSETHYLSYISSPDGLVAMHISDDAGRDEMKYVLTDYLGTIYALVDDGAQSTDDALYYSFNAWGERRELQAYDGSLAAPLFSDPADYITSRGYTGHEHIDAFELINMNGRAYDPVVGAFLSPDPYVQAPDMPQNLNRYAYCLNNPLKYTDPSGEFFIEAMMIGAFTNIFFQGVTGNLHNLGDALFAGGIGALSGAAGFGAGQMVAGVAGNIGFAAGAVTGASGGFAGGFVGGAANAWANGAGFLDGLTQGFIGGAIGAGIGGLSGGIAGGIRARNHGGNFFTGEGAIFKSYADPNLSPENVKVGESMKYSTDYASDIAKKTYGELEYVKKLAVNEIPVGKNVGETLTLKNGCIIDSNGDMVNGLTRYMGGGNSEVYLGKSAFTSKMQLKLTIGHEYIHATHNYMYSIGKIKNINAKYGGLRMTEYSAYNWEANMGVNNGYKIWNGSLGEFSWKRKIYFNWLINAKF